MAKQLTEEDLKKMSPEEISALQKQNCIFCQIISGRVPSKKIYEDKDVIAILDIYPATHGHVLILPKEHYAIMPQVPEKVIKHMGMVSKAISHSLLRGLNAKATNIFIANGAVAGQKAAHFMVHVIPRKENDGLDFNIPENKIAEMQLEKVRGIVLKRLAELMKKTEKELVKDYEKADDISQTPPTKNVKEKEAEKIPAAKQNEQKTQKKSEEDLEDEMNEVDEDLEEKPQKKDVKENAKSTASKKKETDDEDEKDVSLDDIANLFS